MNTFASGHWIGVPQFVISWAITYREDWLKEAGFEYPKTWDDFRKVGRAMKAKGKPFGQAFGHSINDPNNWCYPMVWMWAAPRCDTDGRSVVLNSKNTRRGREVQQHAVEGSASTRAASAWDDSNNNRAFLSSEISLTGNAPSIYVAARQKFPDVYKGTNHGHYPPGPAGRLLLAAGVELGRDEVLARTRRSPRTSSASTWTARGSIPTSRRMDTFGIPGTQAYRDNPLWKKDPKTAVFRRHCRRRGRWATPGRPAARPPRCCRKYIIVDMFAKAIQGMKPEDAVAWASRRAEESL